MEEEFDAKDDLENCVYPIFGRKDESNNTPTPYENNSKEEPISKRIVKIDSNTLKIKEDLSCFYISLFLAFTLNDLIIFIFCIIQLNSIWVKIGSFFVLCIIPFVFGTCNYDIILKLGENSILLTERRILYCFNKTHVYKCGELKFFGIFYSYIRDEEEDCIHEYYEIKLVKTSGQKRTIFTFNCVKDMNLNGYKNIVDKFNEHIQKNMT